MKMGEYIKELRTNKGLTQEEQRRGSEETARLFRGHGRDTQVHKVKSHPRSEDDFLEGTSCGGCTAMHNLPEIIVLPERG